jgi:hypothetical protein
MSSSSAEKDAKAGVKSYSIVVERLVILAIYYKLLFGVLISSENCKLPFITMLLHKVSKATLL